MAIPEHVKRQATSAALEARPHIMAMRSASHADLSTRHDSYPAAPTRSLDSMPEAQKRHATSAVREAAPHLRMMRDTGTVEASHLRAPANDNVGRQSADRVAQMQKSGHTPSAIQQDLTKQDFARNR